MARSYNIIVTGGARRLGAAVVRRLVARGHRVVIHHHRSGDEARALAAGLGDGAVPIAADLADHDGLGAFVAAARAALGGPIDGLVNSRSEEHTSELQSLMRNSYAVFCLKTTTQKPNNNQTS